MSESRTLPLGSPIAWDDLPQQVQSAIRDEFGDVDLSQATLTIQPPDWKLGRWLQVIAPDGSLWCETSDVEEARESMRPGDRLYRICERQEFGWVELLTEMTNSPAST